MQLSELRNVHTNSLYYFIISICSYCCSFHSQFAQNLSLESLANTNLKSLSPVPEENESADFDNDSGKKYYYL